MQTIIYRKSDKLIVGIAHERRTSELTIAAVASELSSILASELAGISEDYGTVEVEQATFAGKNTVVNSDGSVTWVDTPAIVAKRKNKASAQAKLKALGLTDEEVAAL